MLIDLPARQLAKLTPARIALAVILVAAIAGLIAFSKSDGLIWVAQGVPEAIGETDAAAQAEADGRIASLVGNGLRLGLCRAPVSAVR